MMTVRNNEVFSIKFNFRKSIFRSEDCIIRFSNNCMIFFFFIHVCFKMRVLVTMLLTATQSNVE